MNDNVKPDQALLKRSFDAALDDARKLPDEQLATFIEQVAERIARVVFQLSADRMVLSAYKLEQRRRKINLRTP